MNTETVEGWIYDTETGECLGPTMPLPINPDTPTVHGDWRPQTQEDVEWVLGLMHEAEAEAQKQTQRAADILANIERLRKRAEGRRQWLECRFSADVEHVTNQLLGDGKARSIVTLYGRVGFRKSPGSIKVLDKQAAIDWLFDHYAEAISYDPRVVVGPLKGHEAELPRTAFEVTEPSDKFYIDLGGAK